MLKLATETVIWPLAQALLPIIGPALAGWVVKRLLTRWGIEADDTRRKALNEALYNGIMFSIQALGLGGKTNLSAAEQKVVIQGAANYAAKKVPDTVKKLGVPSGSLFDLAMARFPKVAADLNLWGK